MWAFLATEMMFFGGAFLGYAVYRYHYPDAFAAASRLENWQIGALQHRRPAVQQPHRRPGRPRGADGQPPVDRPLAADHDRPRR